MNAGWRRSALARGGGVGMTILEIERPDSGLSTAEERACVLFGALGEACDLPLFNVQVRALDRAAISLQAKKDELLLPLAKICHRMVERRGWRDLGYVYQRDYVRERHQRSVRWLSGLDRLYRACEKRARLGGAVTGRDGGEAIGQQKALAIASGDFDEEIVDALIERAREVPLRQLQHDVRQMIERMQRLGEDDREAERERHVRGLREEGRRCAQEAVADEGAAGAASETVVTELRGPTAHALIYDEVRDLHSALSGGPVSDEEFVEAVIGEVRSGRLLDEVDAPGAPVGGVELVARSPRPGAAAIERRLAGDVADFTRRNREIYPGSERVRRALERARRFMEEPLAPLAPAQLADAIDELVALRDELDRLLGTVLLEITRRRTWTRHGDRGLPFASLGHYAEGRLGIARSTAYQLVRLERSLEKFPLLAAEYAAGRAGRISLGIAADLLGEAAAVDAQTERQWAQAVRTMTVRRLVDELREGRRRLAEDPDRAPAPLDDRDWYDALERRAGRTRARVERLLAAVPLSFRRMTIRLRLSADLAAEFDSFLGAVSLAAAPVRTFADGQGCWRGRLTHGQAFALALVDCARAWDPPAAHEIVPCVAPGAAWAAEGVGADSAAGAVGEVEVASSAAGRRRSARPSRRASVYERDGWRCAVPGCTSRRGLESHHVQPRARGGAVDDDDNQVTLCWHHHHEGVHDGRLHLRGRAPLDLTWRLGRPGEGSWFRNDRRLN
jgi:hypothetical protein